MKPQLLQGAKGTFGLKQKAESSGLIESLQFKVNSNTISRISTILFCKDWLLAFEEKGNALKFLDLRRQTFDSLDMKEEIEVMKCDGKSVLLSSEREVFLLEIPSFTIKNSIKFQEKCIGIDINGNCAIAFSKSSLKFFSIPHLKFLKEMNSQGSGIEFAFLSNTKVVVGFSDCWLFLFERNSFELKEKVFLGFQPKGGVDFGSDMIIFGESSRNGKIAFFKGKEVKVLTLKGTTISKIIPSENFLIGHLTSGAICKINMEKQDVEEKSVSAPIIDFDICSNFVAFLHDKFVRIYDPSILLNKWKNHETTLSNIFSRSENPSEEKIEEPPKGKSMSGEVNSASLIAFCKKFGSFPDKFRKQSYNVILSLPQNTEAFESLTKLGNAKMDFEFLKNEQISSSVLRRMEKVLTAFGNHCVVFRDAKILSPFVLPFASAFKKANLFCFESVFCFLVNWTKPFWITFPQPPQELLLCLHQTFVSINGDDWLSKNNFSFVKIFWPLMTNICFKTLSEELWIRFLDFLVCNYETPEIYLHFLLNLVSEFKKVLIKLKPDHAYQFFETKQPIRFDMIVRNTYKSFKNYPNISKFFGNKFEKLSPKIYQQINIFSQTKISEYQSLRKKLERDEEIELQKENIISNLHVVCEELIKKKDLLEKEQRIAKESHEIYLSNLLNSNQIQNNFSNNLIDQEKRLMNLKKLENQIKSMTLKQSSSNNLGILMENIKDQLFSQAYERNSLEKVRQDELEALKNLSLALAENLQYQKENFSKELTQFHLLNNGLTNQISNIETKETSLKDFEIQKSSNLNKGQGNFGLKNDEIFKSPLASKQSFSHSNSSFSEFQNEHFTPNNKDFDLEGNSSYFSSPDYLRSYSIKKTQEFSTLKNHFEEEISFLKDVGKLSENSSSFSSAAFENNAN